MNQRCYCIFEGGGAKGIAHIGALAALQKPDLKLDLVGFAGTSAGAIIAALAAVGYTAEEMFGPEKSVLDEIDLDKSNIWSGSAQRPVARPTRLFGVPGWLAIRFARRMSVPIVVLLLVSLLLAAPILMSLGLIALAGIWTTAIAVIALGALCLWLLSEGLAELKALEWAVNQALSLRLARSFKLEPFHEGRSPRAITFKQLEDAGCPALKIVASDITNQKLVLFSAATSPNDSVAAAVAASVCLPVIFKPWKINERLHLDGGLVSNLPAWTFDAERAVDPDAWTAVVELGDIKAQEKTPRGPAILSAAISTGIFGSGLLNVRNVDRLRAVRLNVDLKLLQFDLNREVATKVIEAARKQCVRKLVYQLDAVPKLMGDICQRLALRAQRTINKALKTQGKPEFAGHLRVAMLMPVGDDRVSLLVEHSHGHENHLDERIRLPLAGSFAGQALKEWEALYTERRDPSWDTYLARPEDRCTRKLIWPDMLWCLCVPYEHRPSGTKFAVGIDADRYIDLPADLVDATMGSLSGKVIRMLDRYLPRGAFQDGGQESDENGE